MSQSEEISMEHMSLVIDEMNDEMAKTLEYSIQRAVDLKVPNGIIRTGISHAFCNLWFNWLSQLDKQEAAELFASGCEQISNDILEKTIEKGRRKHGTEKH
jgi:hypothetical protein